MKSRITISFLQDEQQETSRNVEIEESNHRFVPRVLGNSATKVLRRGEPYKPGNARGEQQPELEQPTAQRSLPGNGPRNSKTQQDLRTRGTSTGPQNVSTYYCKRLIMGRLEGSTKMCNLTGTRSSCKTFHLVPNKGNAVP